MKKELLLCLVLCGCNALPASGPEERDILHSQTKANTLGFHIVDIDARTTPVLDTELHAPFDTLADLAGPTDADTIGPGDVLTISVFEIGNGLFAGSAGAGQPGATAGISTSATRETLPQIAVDHAGFIDVPYIGRLLAAGHTPGQLQQMIRAGLGGHSQDPQVVVEIVNNIANTVIVGGQVSKPGRIPLTLSHERLLDVIALAGGADHPVQDIVVVVDRHGRTAMARLTTIEHDPLANPAMRPQDRVELLYRPRTYTVFGATKVAEMPFDAPRVSLAESIARSGGPSDERADPNAVFLFRYESPDVARALGVPVTGKLIPIIYHLDLMKTDSYFLAQTVPMRDKDLIYIANARTDQLGKFLGLISALFTPAIVARSVD